MKNVFIVLTASTCLSNRDLIKKLLVHDRTRRLGSMKVKDVILVGRGESNTVVQGVLISGGTGVMISRGTGCK